MPAGNLTLTANFTIMVYTITAEPNNSNYGTVSGAGQYEYGDIATLTAFPEEGCEFVVWTEDGQVVSNQEIYIFIVVSDRDLIAHFQLISACPKPVALSVDEITEISATIHWVPSGSEDEWDVLWGLSGFDTITQGELISGLTEIQYVLEGLEQGTFYDFYVRAVCSDILNSGWAGPESFSTLYVGLEQVSKSPSFVIYPNPASDKLYLRYEQNSRQAQQLHIINSLGVVVMKRNEPIHDNYCLHINGLCPGIYIIQLLFDNNISSRVFIIRY